MSLSMTRGSTPTITIRVTRPDGQPADLTGTKLLFTIKRANRH